MEEKRVLIVFLVLGIVFSIVNLSAQEDKEIEKSYSCLKKQLESNCGKTQNTVQAAFNLLAMAHDSKIQSDCRSLLNNNKKNNCWADSFGSSVCTIKASAISALALAYVNENVDDYLKWLESKKKMTSELVWYLEIDPANETECSINGQSFKIGENKKISGSDPQGLVKSYNNYWFQINDLTKNYTISCNSDFVTALIYKKPLGGTYYVSTEAHSTAAFDSVTESVNSYCFSISEKCDYEGTLWASLLFSRMNKDINPYLPYLVAMAEESANLRYLPYAFLFMLDNSALDYLSNLLSLQKLNKYWEVSENKFYDSSIALLALQNGVYQEAVNTKNYLLSQRISSGDNEGCWPSYTSLILFAGWPKAPVLPRDDGGKRNCEDFNYSCTSRSECSFEDTLTNFDCNSLSEVCCRVKPIQLTCEQKNGFVCKNDEECTGSVVPSADEKACCVMGSCQKISKVNECENNDGFCKTSCSSDEEEKELFSSSCSFGEVCCMKKLKEEKVSSWWIVVVLIVLIIFTIIAIIFRNKLRIWLFWIKSRFKGKKTPPETPAGVGKYPPAFARRHPIIPRQIIPKPATPSLRQKPVTRTPKDKEFEEVMKKLKEMSK